MFYMLGRLSSHCQPYALGGGRALFHGHSSARGPRQSPQDTGAPGSYLLSSLRPSQSSCSSCWLCLCCWPTSCCSLSFSAFTQANWSWRCSRSAAFLERDSRNFSFSFCLSENTKRTTEKRHHLFFPTLLRKYSTSARALQEYKRE